ncbi:MAG: hypothetical protein DWI28_03590 [Planctomycetota bacterium]|nr:MAG: hypothetical protein DWI28_03590 [Planctomycetota bacterium]
MFQLKPKGIAGGFKPMVEPGIGIMGRLAEANGIGPLGFHRRRIHRRGGQEVDEVSAETFALFTSDKDSQMDRLKKPNFEGKGTDLVL